MSKKHVLQGIGQTAQGFYKVAVVDDATNEVVYESPWGKNLILNQGMEQVAIDEWCDLFLWGICGQGAAANTVDSVTTVASQTGTTVTAVGANIDFTTDASVGDMIKWDTGQEARITSITNALVVEATPSQSVPSGEFTIYRTARVGLQTETKRSNSYLTGTGNCGSTQSGNTLQHRRTYDFTVESGNVTYTEVGVGWAATLATRVFSRVLLDTPVSLVSGQRLRLVYQLNITYTPSTSTAKNLPIGGWPVAPATTTDGVEQIQSICASSVNTGSGGTSVFQGSFPVLDPAGVNSVTDGRMFSVSSDSAAPSAFGSQGTRSTNAALCSVAPTNASYAALSFQLDVSTVFQVADAVMTNIRSIVFGGRNSPSIFPYSVNQQGMLFVFNENQTKTNTQTLTITVRFTWARVLA